jgi:hypothetical protein
LLVTLVSEKVRAAAPGGWQSLTAGELTAQWWEWLYGLPVSQSPAVDDAGANAFNGQPFSGVLFLAGTYITDQASNGDITGAVMRKISVKQGTALFGRVRDLRLADGFCFNQGRAPSV